MGWTPILNRLGMATPLWQKHLEITLKCNDSFTKTYQTQKLRQTLCELYVHQYKKENTRTESPMFTEQGKVAEKGIPVKETSSNIQEYP